MDAETYRKHIESNILDIIEKLILARKMNAARAKEIAQYILDSLKPYMDLESVYNIVKHFDEHFPELISVVLEVENDHEEQIKNIVGDRVAVLLRQNKITEANDLLEQTLKK